MPWAQPPVDATEETVAALREQFAVEKELAARLMAAPREERGRLYGEIYDEFFRRLPNQPQLAQKSDAAAQAQLVALQTHLLEPFLRPDTVYLEVGAGDACLALSLASRVAKVMVLEASSEIVAGLERPANFVLVPVRGSVCDLPDAQADLAFSCHFLEHLHPDDASDHAREMARLLRPGGVYVCVTPNRIYGPHDVSRYFADRAEGLHLHEYTHGELGRLLRRGGFARVARLAGIGRTPDLRALAPAALAEAAVDRLPTAWRRRLLESYARSRQMPFRPLEQVMVVGFR